MFLTYVAPTAADVDDITGVLGLFEGVFEWILGAISKVVDVVMANPLLLIPIAVVCTYTVIRVFKSLF